LQFCCYHPQFKVSGDPRLMSCDSPFNAAEKQFFEVHVPV